MGSPAVRVVLTYGGLPCFRSGGEMTCEVGCEALTGEECWGGQSRGAVAAPSSFQCSNARKKGEG
jgi:hypothetical protein